MTEYFAQGGADSVIDLAHAGALLDSMLAQLGTLKRVLIIPPDFTRFHSWAGELTVLLYERLKGQTQVEIMPALGTHVAMKPAEITRMFPGIPHGLFQVHDWRTSLSRLGEVPSKFIQQVTGGKLDYPIYCEINRLLVEGQWDRIISVGQLVPHEVIGIANQNKNIYVGVGGQDTINKTHFIGAVCGMESIMGRESSPVRDVLNYAESHFGKALPVSYVLTVRAKDISGSLVTRGLYAGDDTACYLRGSDLCRQVNLDLMEKPLRKAVVYLDPAEFKSTWLGNKAIYRTRMAMADDGELLILAPGVGTFGEDSRIDTLIRKYGYHGTEYTLEMVKQHEELRANLSAAAHLIHGSSEGRFRITYCTGYLTREEVEAVGFSYANLPEMTKRYDPKKLHDGFNVMDDGEEVFFVSNPALGLWGLKSQFNSPDSGGSRKS